MLTNLTYLPPTLLFCHFQGDDEPILLVNAEPTLGQHQRYTDNEDKDKDKDKDEDEDEDEDEEALDKIPGNADDPHGFKRENKDKVKLSCTWKTNEFWNYIDSQLEELRDEICNLLPDRNLQDEKFRICVTSLFLLTH